MSTLSIEQTVALRRARSKMIAAQFARVHAAASGPTPADGYFVGDEWYWNDEKRKR